MRTEKTTSKLANPGRVVRVPFRDLCCRRLRPFAFSGMILFCLFLIACGRQQPAAQIPDREVVEEQGLARYCGSLFGQDEAPLRIEAVLPISSGCQDDVGLYLVDLAKARPDLFRVQIYAMKSDSGQALLKRHGVHCAAIFVNGKTRFDLGQKYGKVLLEGPMDPLDLYHVLETALQKHMPQPPFVLPEPEAGDAPTAEQRRRAGFQ